MVDEFLLENSKLENIDKINQDEFNVLIKLCIELEMYEEAYEYFILYLDKNAILLSEEHRNQFMVISKEKINNLRKSWNALTDSEVKDEKLKNLIDYHTEKTEEKIKSFSQETQIRIDNFIRQTNKNDIYVLIFYYKLKADYLRYSLDVADQNEFDLGVQECEEIYEKVYGMCIDLEPYHPLKLGVIINYSVFIDNILNDQAKAKEISDKGYKEAIEGLRSENKTHEVEISLKIIEENLNIWNIKSI